MNWRRVAAISRSLVHLPSRRDLLRAQVSAGFSPGLSRLPGAAARKRKPKKAKPNAFGCLNVGDPCRRKTQCCSGICQGKKRCTAHDATTCWAGDHEPFCGDSELVLSTTSTGFAGQCNTTTGNAGYCLASSICYPCAKDADCRTVCGAKAAWLTCTDCMETSGTMCGNPDFPGCSAI